MFLQVSLDGNIPEARGAKDQHSERVCDEDFDF